MLFADVLARFAEVSEHGDGGYIARCPGHDDSRPSLRIWRGNNGTVRIHCRANCPAEKVVRSAGLTWSDLFESSGPGNTVPAGRAELVGPGPVAALAQYIDRAGIALLDFGSAVAETARTYALTRFGLDWDSAAEQFLGVDGGRVGGKQFPHLSRAFTSFPRLVVPLRGFDGVARGLQGRDLTGRCPGRWVSLTNPPGARWSPYGVFRGQGGYSTTIITEGPGDALTVVGVGYDAVAIRGAGLATSADLVAELAEGLRGQLVIVAGDQDNAGAGFTARLAEGLAEHGIDAYRMELPIGVADLTAWRESDPEGFPAALHAAVRTARPVRDAAEVAAARDAAEVVGRTGAELVTADQGAEAARVLAGLLETYGDSDAMRAHALVAWSDGSIRHAPGLGFYVWDGRTWIRSATRVRQEIHRMGAALVLAGERKLARSFLSTVRIDALMTELRAVPTVHVDAAEFDARPHLLAFTNGTVDLRTGELRPHDRRDMLTYALDIAYDPDAPCPRWERFLGEIFPGQPEMPAYMRRLIGYGITGSTAEQCFAIMYGKGANGKSVMTDVLSSVFGAITRTTPFATFEARQSGGIPNDIAALRGARLVLASEGEAGAPMSEALIKRMTGKDMVSARFLRQEFFEFRPAFLLLLATNHRPTWRGQDDGLWRRVRLVPFVRWFAPEEREHDLDRQLVAEAAGIAAWAVRGAVEWYAGGLREPESITGAGADYRATSDALAGFFPGQFELAESSEVLGADVFTAYLEWCVAENLPARERWTRRAFYAAMEERGVPRRKTMHGIALIGIRAAAAPAPVTGPGIFA